jgi:methionine synthase I (cobalamin-dependent)
MLRCDVEGTVGRPSWWQGERFKDYHKLVKGNNDLLTLTQPEIIKGIHRQYLLAGADLIGTNTFSSTTIAQVSRGNASEDLVRRLVIRPVSDKCPRGAFVTDKLGLLVCLLALTSGLYRFFADGLRHAGSGVRAELRVV